MDVWRKEHKSKTCVDMWTIEIDLEDRGKQRKHGTVQRDWHKNGKMEKTRG